MKHYRKGEGSSTIRDLCSMEITQVFYTYVFGIAMDTHGMCALPSMN